MSLKMIENERAAALSNSLGDFFDRLRRAERVLFLRLRPVVLGIDPVQPLPFHMAQPCVFHSRVSLIAYPARAVRHDKKVQTVSLRKRRNLADKPFCRRCFLIRHSAFSTLLTVSTPCDTVNLTSSPANPNP